MGNRGIRESGNPGIGESGNPGVRESGNRGIRESGNYRIEQKFNLKSITTIATWFNTRLKEYSRSLLAITFLF